MKTTLKKPSEIERKWYKIDAKGVALGRLSTKVATILMGKHRVDYTPYSDMGDCVVVINAALTKFTGNKLDQKKYTHFSGYPGGISTTYLRELMEKKPDFVIRESVRGMLPKNKLRRNQLRRLKVSAGEDNATQTDITI